MKMKLANEITLPPSAATDVFAIMGKRGAGKSYTGTLLFELLYAAGAQCVALDPIGSWWALRVDADGKSPGLPITVFGGRHGDLPITGDKDHARLIARVIVERKLSAVVDVSRLDDIQQKQFATAFAQELFRLKQDSPSPLHLFLEEASTFLPQEKEDGYDVPMLVALKKIARKGRNYGIGLSMLDQRPQDVSKKALNQAEIMIVMQLIGSQERDAIKKWVVDKEFEYDLTDLKKLQAGEAFVFSPGLLRGTWRVKMSEKRTYDESATPKIGTHRSVEPQPLDQAEIEKLRGALSEVTAKADAVDPRKLRAEIVKLQSELAAARAAKPASPTVEIKTERLLTKDDEKVLEAFAKAAEKLNGSVTALVDKTGALKDQFGDQLQGLATKTLNLIGLGAPARQLLSEVNAAARARALPAPPRPALVRPETPVFTSRRVATEELGAAGSMPKGETAVLSALINYPNGLTCSKLAVLVALSTRTIQNILIPLRGKGYVETERGLHVATQAGVAALPHVQPLPRGEALQEFWLSRLPSGEAAVLRTILAAAPEAVPHVALADATGHAPRTIQNILIVLRNRELVETTRGATRACETLLS